MPDLPTGTLTFLFSDIEGSTKLAAALGDRYPAVLEAHQRLLRRAFADHGGVEVGTEGDSFFVVFPSAPGAVSAALAAQRALAGATWPPEAGHGLRVRVGLHTGEAVLGGDSYAGLDVNRAARIGAAAHGGQVLISGPTLALVGHALPAGVSTRDLGSHRLKDLDRPESLHQLVAPDLPADFPPPRTLETPTNLPPQLTRFVGRERETAEVRALLAANRLVTLTGPGGTGKTRLGLRVADDLRDAYPGGVYFVELAPIVDPALIPDQIASAVGIREEPGRPVLETLLDTLRDRRLLLVLDNFEQLIAGAGVVAELLRALPRLTVLTSSREALRLHGEQEYPVPPLGVPDLMELPALDLLSQYDAVALFIDRARAASPSFDVNSGNAPAVAAICAHLDGLPLAIELAAARIKLFTPDQLLARLDKSLLMLTGGSRDLPARQQTLRGAIEWSHNLLGDAERALFRRLAVFGGGFTLGAAEQVVDADGLELDLLDGVSSLLDKSLIRRTDAAVDAASEPRFVMLETIREFGRELLAASPDSDDTPGRHGRYFADLAAAAEPHLLGVEQKAWLDRLEPEQANMRLAIGWFAEHGEIGGALRMAGQLWRFWHLRAHLREGRQLCEDLLARADAVAPAVGLARGHGLKALGGLAYWQGDFLGAERAYREWLDIARAADDEREIAEALYNGAYVVAIVGGADDAAGMYEESLERFERLGDPGGVTRVREGLVVLRSRARAYREAYELEAAALVEYRAQLDRFHIANALGVLAMLSAMLGEPDRARAELAEAIAIFEGAEDRSSSLLALILGAHIAAVSGHPRTAAQLLGGYRHQSRLVGSIASPLEILALPDPFVLSLEALGEATWQSELATGAVLTMDELVRIAVSTPVTASTRPPA